LEGFDDLGLDQGNVHSVDVMEDEGFIDSFLSLFFFLEFGQFQVGLLDVPEEGIF
jgi:hypothetical protein